MLEEFWVGLGKDDHPEGMFLSLPLTTNLALPWGQPDPWVERGPATLELQNHREHSTL